MSAAQRELDIVLYGATGFVGKLTAEYLAKAGGDARIALAGRSHDKLLAVRDTLGEAAQSWPLIAADASQPSTLNAMAARTQVVVTTVGPVHPVRLAVGGRVRRRGYRLRRPDRRVDVHPRKHRPLSQAGRSTPAPASCTHADSIPSLRISPSSRCTAAPQQDQAGELGDTNFVVRVVRRWGVRRHRRLDDRGHAHGVDRPGGPTADERPVHADARPCRRTRTGRASPTLRWRRGRDIAPELDGYWVGRVRHGGGEHPNCPAQQRITRLRVRQAVPSTPSR